MIVIADNVQANHGAIQTAVQRGDPGPVRSLARRIEAAGARMLDISVAPPGRDGARKMAFLVEAIQSVTDLPVLIDTADADVVAAGCQKTPAWYRRISPGEGATKKPGSSVEYGR